MCSCSRYGRWTRIRLVWLGRKSAPDATSAGVRTLFHGYAVVDDLHGFRMSQRARHRRADFTSLVWRVPVCVRSSSPARCYLPRGVCESGFGDVHESRPPVWHEAKEARSASGDSALYADAGSTFPRIGRCLVTSLLSKSQRRSSSQALVGIAC